MISRFQNLYSTIPGIQLFLNMSSAPYLSMITVRGKETSEDIPEWTAVELQGTLKQRDNADSPAGREIGDLEISDDRMSAVLKIGNQELKGQLVKLAKPCAVTRKRKEEDGPIPNSDGDVEMEGDKASNNRSGAEYKVVAVIRSKYIFKTRPKPIDGLQHKRQRLGYVQLDKP